MKQRQNITAILYDRRGNVLSIGKNNYLKTHPLQAFHAARAGQPYKIWLHAEIDAIVRCKQLTKAHKMVIIRIKADGTEGNAKPCPVCEQAIKAAGIRIVEHS